MITNRPRRLDGISYVGYQRYFLTTCTDRRHKAFLNDQVARDCVAQLLRTAASFDFAIAAYCFMPNHAHVLAYGTSLKADLRAFVIDFKKRTAHAHSKRMNAKLWQSGYYEHVLRDDEATEAVARYIFENPIRAGLTKTVGEYPYAGSDLFDYKEV